MSKPHFFMGYFYVAVGFAYWFVFPGGEKDVAFWAMFVAANVQMCAGGIIKVIEGKKQRYLERQSA